MFFIFLHLFLNFGGYYLPKIVHKSEIKPLLLFFNNTVLLQYYMHIDIKQCCLRLTPPSQKSCRSKTHKQYNNTLRIFRLRNRPETKIIIRRKTLKPGESPRCDLINKTLRKWKMASITHFQLKFLQVPVVLLDFINEPMVEM